MKRLSMNAKGFSLVELMIVVGIIGILATLAVPKFTQFQAKAKMTEAKSILAQVHSLQESYYLDNNGFAKTADTYGYDGTTFNCSAPGSTTWMGMIGFTLTPCTKTGTRFLYSISAAGTGTFAAQASSLGTVCTEDGSTAMGFQIDQTRTLMGFGGNTTGTAAAPVSPAPSACAK